MANAYISFGRLVLQVVTAQSLAVAVVGLAAVVAEETSNLQTCGASNMSWLGCI